MPLVRAPALHHPFLALAVGLALGGTGRASAQSLAASEVPVLAQLRAWRDSLGELRPLQAIVAPRFEARFFGYAADGTPGASHEFRFATEYASIAVAWPGRDAIVPARPLMMNSLGQVFVGEAPAGASGWPAFASVVAADVPPHLNNMLLQSGIAADGTEWRRVEAVEGDDAAVLRPLRVRVLRLDGGELDGFLLEIGRSPLLWDPSFTAIEGEGASAWWGRVEVTGRAEGRAVGAGLPAVGLAVRLSRAVPGGDRVARLLPGDVRMVRGELLVVLRDGTLVDREVLRRQAWAAEALRRLCRHELAARAAVTIDRDGDGIGEFGDPDEVVPTAERSYRRVDGDRLEFEGHLFEVWLADSPDVREHRFAAGGWPATPRGPDDLAFAVDQRGVVYCCSAVGRFAGGERPLTASALEDDTLGWRALEFR
ncbi:MAG: hypothetical protein KDE27_09340 [Planctomycetes bacterium]|nr:hypothetical protein [Planctomycetota bacterium]